MRITKNDKKVLKLLLDNGRATDSEIACKMKITPQAVGKIRQKLEKNNIIKGYSCKIDYEKIGINIFGIAFMNLNDDFWNKIKKENNLNLLKSFPSSVYACMPISSDVSIISIYGFRNLKEMDRYAYLKKIQMAKFGDIVKIYPFSVDNIIKNDDSDLIKLILDNKKNIPNTFCSIIKK